MTSYRVMLHYQEGRGWSAGLRLIMELYLIMLALDQVSMLIQVCYHDYHYHDYHCYVIVTGLPCDSLALDEDRVYWTENGLAVVFYVTRDDRNSLLSYSVPNRDSVIISSSPGVQQLPQQGKKKIIIYNG